MRINYTLWGTGCTGGIRVVFEIMNRLVERGHDVTVTSLGSRGDHAWFPLKATVNYVRNGIARKALRYGVNSLLNNRFIFYDSMNLLKNLTPDCDVNVATLCFTAFSVYESKKGAPFYHMQHYEPLFFQKPDEQVLAEESYGLPVNRIANSTWLKNQLREKYGLDAPVINPGTNLDTFYPRDVERDNSKKRIVCFGKQTPWKGFPDALEAMKLVMKQRNDVEFIAYGSSPVTYRNPAVPYEFMQGIPDDELAKLYSSADAVICPSWYESFPLPPIEAMACGAPVVTTRYGTEDYAFNEKNSLVVQPRDPKAMADAVLRILSDDGLKEDIKKSAIKTARKFTWGNTVDKFESMFKDAVKAGG